MELPDDVLRIIKEYSMPITRPDWKRYIIISEKTLHNLFEQQLSIRHFKLRNANRNEYLRLRSYKPIFDNNYYKDFKNHFYDYKIES
jgi:hypothetical protein